MSGGGKDKNYHNKQHNNNKDRSSHGGNANNSNNNTHQPEVFSPPRLVIEVTKIEAKNPFALLDDDDDE
jgi:hypothetical protein